MDDVQPPKTSGPSKPTNDFKTPEEAAAIDDLQQPAPTVSQSETDNQASGNWLSRHWPPSSKQEWAILAILVLVLGLGGYLVFGHHSQPSGVKKPTLVIKKPTPKSVTVPSTLTGLPVDPSTNKLPVTAVMVENSLDARPQSGLSQAGVVFEAIAEGGVTRFMALYQDTAPASVGPIRSARPYYVQWLLGFDAAYAHVGGSPDALSDIKAWGVKDLNQFYNGAYYQRVSSRPAPHNVYTGIPTLNQLETNKGYTTSTYTGFVRNTKAGVASKQPTAASINFVLSGHTYDAQYNYNPTTNSYERSEAGAPLTDAATGQILAPKVVVAMVVPETRGALDASGAYYSDYHVIGSGTVYVFQDGLVATGTWTKASNTSQITFTGADGQPLKLEPGQTWLTAVFNTGNVSYRP